MKQTTRSMTHGAITAALTVVLLLVDRMLAGFLMSFLPLPLIIYGLYYPLNQSIITYVVTVLLVMIIPGQLPTTIMMITYGFVGLVYIWAHKKDVSDNIKFFIVFLGNFINYFIMMKFFGSFFGMEFNLLITQVQGFLKFLSPSLVKVLAMIIVLFTIALETVIIFLSARQLTYLMKSHRK